MAARPERTAAAASTHRHPVPERGAGARSVVRGIPWGRRVLRPAAPFKGRRFRTDLRKTSRAAVRAIAAARRKEGGGKSHISPVMVPPSGGAIRFQK